MLLANAAALQGGAAELETTIDGQRWVQPPFPYQGRCLQALRTRYGQLGADGRAAADDLLTGTGCEALFA